MSVEDFGEHTEGEGELVRVLVGRGKGHCQGVSLEGEWRGMQSHVPLRDVKKMCSVQHLIHTHESSLGAEWFVGTVGAELAFNRGSGNGHVIWDIFLSK